MYILSQRIIKESLSADVVKIYADVVVMLLNINQRDGSAIDFYR
jgi:hypothetical protein